MIRRVARPMLAAIFVTGGFNTLRHPGRVSALAEPIVSKVTQTLGLPNDPEMAVRANGALQTAAGLMLATGRMPRLSSTLLAASLVPTTLAGHPFWQEKDPASRAKQQIDFTKNLGLVGGLLLAAVDTAGKPGLTWRAQHAVGSARREARLAKAQAQLAIR